MSAPFLHRAVSRAATRPLSADELGAWRRFLKKADRAGRDPVGQAEVFQRAAERVGKKLRLPPGQQHRESPLFLLVRLGREFLKRDRAERAGAGAEIARLVVLSRAIIDPAMAAATEGREVRVRKDIDG